jgi:hypothetical protein
MIDNDLDLLGLDDPNSTVKQAPLSAAQVKVANNITAVEDDLLKRFGHLSNGIKDYNELPKFVAIMQVCHMCWLALWLNWKRCGCLFPHLWVVTCD